MKIGDLARLAHCPAVTIRYYEKIGLMPDERRDRQNHRRYDASDMERLRFIIHCRNHRIPLADIRILLNLKDGCGNGGTGAVSIIRSHIENLQSQRQSLNRLIASLSALLDFCGRDNGDGQEIIEVLGSPCPHCPDYAELISKGEKPDCRAACLTGPAVRKGRPKTAH